MFTGCASAGAVESPSAPSEAQADDPEPPVVMTTEAATLDDALATADALASDLNNYEDQRAQTTNQLEEATSQALNALENAPSTEAVREATRAWREDWDAVREEVDLLATRYAEVAARTVGYFHHLDAQTANISNADLRAEEQERNDEIHESWRSTASEATHALRTLRANLKNGDDLYVTMLNASLRSGFDTHVERLRALGEETHAALESLESITSEGEALVGSLDEPSSDSSASDDAASSNE
ncbi:hypothetical protein CRI93_11860 [Longimonas halophila]|uniref:Uncharacterized protein n=1 Tax=Longimonas halophila TaxID=1469170 RepID=A0A2H3NJI1_9BACT|nr:hypothetical protein CRI93_11860 [Longimonas halophila]